MTFFIFKFHSNTIHWISGVCGSTGHPQLTKKRKMLHGLAACSWVFQMIIFKIHWSKNTRSVDIHSKLTSFGWGEYQCLILNWDFLCVKYIANCQLFFIRIKVVYYYEAFPLQTVLTTVLTWNTVGICWLLWLFLFLSHSSIKLFNNLYP